MESPPTYEDFPGDADEANYLCKGCGEILEEGKAYELAGLRWHIDCFRCYTCSNFLDSGANLLLLGDGSLICNDCTYSCSNCGDKIEELAILTGDQAFCKACFKCRNCKRKIENLRYARTSHGIFCMDCHDALMARRRKKTDRSAAQRQNALLHKSLPSLPPTAPSTSADDADVPLSPDVETPPSDTHSDTPTEAPPRLRSTDKRRAASQGPTKEIRQLSRSTSRSNSQDGLSMPKASNRSRKSSMSRKSDDEGHGGGDFIIPLSFEPTSSMHSSPGSSSYRAPRSDGREYFESSRAAEHAPPLPLSSASNSVAVSPHIAHQDKGRALAEQVVDPTQERRSRSSQTGASTRASPHLGAGASHKDHASSPREGLKSRHLASEEKFKLQEAPPPKKSGGSARSSKSRPLSPVSGFSLGRDSNRGSVKSGEMSGGNSMVVQGSDKPVSPPSKSARTFQDRRSKDAALGDSSRSAPPSTLGQLQHPPKRGDSLETFKVGQSIPRKDVSAGNPKTQESTKVVRGQSATPTTPPASAERVNGAKLIPRVAESPRLRGFSDGSVYKVTESSAANLNGSFVASRKPSSAGEASQARGEARVYSSTPNSGTKPVSAGLPRWSAAGADFSMDEDLARILGEDNDYDDESQGPESFLRKVSKSVRQRRSFGEKGPRSIKEQKWPHSSNTNSGISGYDVSSQTSASPEHRDELSWVKNELRRERQKGLEQDQRISELEASLHSQTKVKQMNSELREKRSTMVSLDTQKEMVIRELETLTEHIAAAKKSGDRLDVSKMRHAVMRDYAESLQKVKDSFAPEIEELVQRRNGLIERLSNLTQLKDKSFQEFEQLSNKNAQLAEFNNQLVHEIHDLYKAKSIAQAEASRAAPNGLGIYSHDSGKSQVSIDSREARTQPNEASVVGSGANLQPEEAEPATVLQGPQVVSIRKGQPKKFNWKKGGQHVAKGVTKGLKGAFSSTQSSYNREMHFTETMPYSSTPPAANEHTNPMSRQGAPDPAPPNFKLFGGNQKHTAKGQQPWKPQSNGSSPAMPASASLTLFGSELEARAEFEKASVPFIVTRCIQEVESRGMDVEGIYRKAGGASQIQVIKEGFEASPQESPDISDLEIDIHAVSSTLKQYLRRLPHPLITYKVYDLLLESPSRSTTEAKVEAQSSAVNELPRVHRDVLEFLMLHLHRVVEREQENLMTSTNLAVVFSPTIMRPESLMREMTDTQVKNEAVQFLVEHCRAIFGVEQP